MKYPDLLSTELPQKSPKSCGLRLASFFCCGGGIDLGFRSAGFELAFANDIFEPAVVTFERNLGHKPVHRDIRGVGPTDYPSGEIDVLTGGFPCVTFSTAGRRAGVTDDINGKLYMELCRVITEMRPRYFVAENVKGLLSANNGAAPKLVLAAFLRLGYRTSFELVNMAEHGVPQTRERVIFVGVRADQWRGEFRFPQKTHRLHDDTVSRLPLARSLLEAIGDLPPPGERVVGGMHADAAAKVGKKRESVGTFQNSKPRSSSSPAHSQTSSGPNVLITGQEPNATPPRKFRTAIRVADPRQPGMTCTASDDTSAPYIPSNPVLGQDIAGARTVSGERRHSFRPSSKPSATIVSTGSVSRPDVQLVTGHAPNDAPVSPKYETSKRLAKKSEPSPTIVSEVANVQPLIIGARNVDFKTGGLRRMTVRECARVQSFPDWYRFPDSQSDAYRLIGNAVPPLYARRLAEAIEEYDRRPKR